MLKHCPPIDLPITLIVDYDFELYYFTGLKTSKQNFEFSYVLLTKYCIIRMRLNVHRHTPKNILGGKNINGVLQRSSVSSSKIVHEIFR